MAAAIVHECEAPRIVRVLVEVLPVGLMIEPVRRVLDPRRIVVECVWDEQIDSPGRYGVGAEAHLLEVEVGFPPVQSLILAGETRAPEVRTRSSDLEVPRLAAVIEQRIDSGP